MIELEPQELLSVGAGAVWAAPLVVLEIGIILYDIGKSEYLYQKNKANDPNRPCDGSEWLWLQGK